VNNLPEERYLTLFQQPKPLAVAWLIFMQTLILIVVIAAAVTGSGAVSWVAVGLLGLVWFYNHGQRRLLARALRIVPRLDEPMTSLEETALPPVTLIAAARNEEEDIEAAVRSWATLNYPDLRIIVVNDHSTDRTGAILDRLATDFPNVTVIHNPELREGWLGKANAIWHAVQQTPETCRWLLLTDADVILQPNTLRYAVTHVEHNAIDFLTCVPRLEHKTLSEQLVLPSLWGALLQAAAPIRNPKMKPRPIGVGAFILVNRVMYLSSGGHAAIRSQQPEDALLALLISQHGGKTGAVWTSDMVRVRLYRGYRDLRRILIRKQRLITDDRLFRLVPGIFMTILCDLLPPTVLPIIGIQVFFLGRTDIAAILFLVLSVLAYLERVRYVRLSGKVNTLRKVVPWLCPIGAVIRLGIQLSAGMGMLLGKPMEWRGRAFQNTRVQSAKNR